MKNLKRDMLVLKQEWVYYGKLFLGMNGFMLLLTVFFAEVIAPPNPIISPRFLGYSMLAVMDGTLLVGFMVKYFVVWRREISELFETEERCQQYRFFYKRFTK
ncbi:hypothetical protein IMZ31_22560 (plasmid) [Pontibacillus sp. ALD_SL1]|uniref:hypothetical protein n=1 Tax=Pontibacillus sp. ALD_SL1 TaxID=2777185 RepID=UPI001A96C8C3|nr:hypothetical protein [Pontibacillus sp. ALD_SL1]QST02239.1 hypothetical protein IMZ31_22560 [Pontibacillus sp. ALD_SL1]